MFVVIVYVSKGSFHFFGLFNIPQKKSQEMAVSWDWVDSQYESISDLA